MYAHTRRVQLLRGCTTRRCPSCIAVTMPVSGRTAVATGGLVIKLSRLPEEATHEELETAIAAVLHKSTQAQDRLVNFKLEMKLHYSSGKLIVRESDRR